MESRHILGHVREIPANVDETRTITFVASDESVDRHGTIIPVKAWDIEPFKNNPIIGWQHNVYGDAMCSDPDPDQIIGKGNAYIDGSRMLVDITFEDGKNNPLAEKIFNKVKSGILNAVSVGFLETKEGRMGEYDMNEDPSVYYFEQVELIEISVVSIPSNKNALRKELRGQTYDALKYIYKELGETKRMSEIEQMTVREILDLIEGKSEIINNKVINNKDIRKVKKYNVLLTDL